MKNIYLFPAFSMIVLLSSCGTSKDFAQGYDEGSPGITYQQFYDGLSPYGNWVDYQNYGYVWVPDEQGFRPYYNNGHWVYTDYGWTWVSNYNWGWAPFHYGRWLYDDAYGWMWVPGYEWAPAWVSWRSGGGCYGWAPLGPGNFDAGIGSRIPYNRWAFVPSRYINSPRVNNYYIAPEKNVTIINNTTVVNNTHITNNKTVYIIGPSATEVEKVTNEKIRTVKVVQTRNPGNTKVSGSTVSIYKPPVRETPQQDQQIRPAKIVKLDELKVRRLNSGGAQNDVPAKEILQKPAVPVNEKPLAPTKREPILIPRTNNSTPPVNEKVNPVIEKEVPVQQPQKVIPVQRVPDIKQENINRESNNNQKIQNPQQNNTINKRPAIINDQPVKERMINPPNRNTENQPRSVSPTAPVNTPPGKMRQVNPVVRPQRVPSSPPAIRQMNRTPIDRTPVFRNPNPPESRGARTEAPVKERK